MKPPDWCGRQNGFCFIGNMLKHEYVTTRTGAEVIYLPRKDMTNSCFFRDKQNWAFKSLTLSGSTPASSMVLLGDAEYADGGRRKLARLLELLIAILRRTTP